MIKRITLLVVILVNCSMSAQIMTIQETIDYLNNKLKDNYYEVLIDLTNDGFLNVHYTKSDNGKYRHLAVMHWSEVKLKTVKADGHYRPRIRFWCKNAYNVSIGETCINITQDYSPYRKAERIFDIRTNDTYTNKKLFNAFTYLFSEIQKSGKYKDSDPFAPKN